MFLTKIGNFVKLDIFWIKNVTSMSFEKKSALNALLRPDTLKKEQKAFEKIKLNLITIMKTNLIPLGGLLFVLFN